MAGSDNESDDASVHSEATIAQQQQNIQPQIITTVSNNNAKNQWKQEDYTKAFPSSWSSVSFNPLKTKGGLELLSFDDLYYKLKTLEVDIKGYSTFSSSQSAGPSHSAFVSTTSASKKMSQYADKSNLIFIYLHSPSNTKNGVSQFYRKNRSGGDGLEMANANDISVRVTPSVEQKAEGRVDFDKKEIC
ncbi:hypothetical protein Tco_0651606 [Tanacetum coccineum]|uniref:Uncharacterized protein n=1 Tax=Tanacetum coccineum TaxID=301880 RepID=A0ABQ4WV95_9ASTR